MAFNHKFTENDYQGIHTVGMGRVRFGSVAVLFNNIQNTKLAIENDPSRTESEKRALIRKLADEGSNKLTAAMDKFRGEVAVNQVDSLMSARNSAQGHKSTVERLQLLSALKAAVPAGTDLRGIIGDSQELSAAVSGLPAEVLRLNDIAPEFVDEMLKKHNPTLAAEQAAYDANSGELRRLEGLVDLLNEDLNKRALGKGDAEKRVDENNLFGDL